MRGPEDVVGDLTEVVEECRREATYLGLLPAMYRSVTEAVGLGTAGRTFVDAAMVQRLVVVFADRYLDAYRAHRSGGRTTRSWALAFEAAEGRWRKSIVQHLLLGMNAHINLDLGIAAAEVCGDRGLDAARSDFTVVNDVLFGRIGTLQDGLNEVSPWMWLLDRWCGDLDETFMQRGIAVARDDAWAFAVRLCGASSDRWPDLIDGRDRVVAGLAGGITRRVSFAHLVNRVVLLRESRDVPLLIDTLGRPPD